jgi:hypothetical protein
MQTYSTIYFEGGLPFRFLNLTTLEVHTAGFGKTDIPGIVCLLKNAPLLDTLKLEIGYYGIADHVSIRPNSLSLTYYFSAAVF